MEMNSMTNSSQQKIGLALSGGSALGLFHVGVLRAFKEQDLNIHCVAGTSAGALVAACFAFGAPLDDMVVVAEKLSWFKLANFSSSFLGLASNKAIGELIQKFLGQANIEDAKIPLAIVATDLLTGEKVVFRKGSVAQAVMASACIPGVFSPVSIDGRVLVDGGLAENLPLSPLTDMGAEIKIGVNLAKWRTYKRPRHLVDVMMTSMDILTHRQTNAAASAADLLIEPHLEHYSPSDLKSAIQLIPEGYRLGQQAAVQIKNMVSSRSLPKRLGWWQKLISYFTRG